MNLTLHLSFDPRWWFLGAYLALNMFCMATEINNPNGGGGIPFGFFGYLWLAFTDLKTFGQLVLGILFYLPAKIVLALAHYVAGH